MFSFKSNDFFSKILSVILPALPLWLVEFGFTLRLRINPIVKARSSGQLWRGTRIVITTSICTLWCGVVSVVVVVVVISVPSSSSSSSAAAPTSSSVATPSTTSTVVTTASTSTSSASSLRIQCSCAKSLCVQVTFFLATKPVINSWFLVYGIAGYRIKKVVFLVMWRCAAIMLRFYNFITGFIAVFVVLCIFIQIAFVEFFQLCLKIKFSFRLLRSRTLQIIYQCSVGV